MDCAGKTLKPRNLIANILDASEGYKEDFFRQCTETAIEGSLHCVACQQRTVAVLKKCCVSSATVDSSPWFLLASARVGYLAFRGTSSEFWLSLGCDVNTPWQCSREKLHVVVDISTLNCLSSLVFNSPREAPPAMA